MQDDEQNSLQGNNCYKSIEVNNYSSKLLELQAVINIRIIDGQSKEFSWLLM